MADGREVTCAGGGAGLFWVSVGRFMMVFLFLITTDFYAALFCFLH